MSEFTSTLLSRFNSLYLRTRGSTDIQTPFDPASELIAFKPLKTSSFALEDARSTPAPSPPPGADRNHRVSAGLLPAMNSERLKMLNHGRSSKICGDLLLVCGFPNQALKQYAEAAVIARANNDHLWQGAALEAIGVCLVFLTYLGISFQIPSVASSSILTQRPIKAQERTSTSSQTQKPDINLIDFLPDLHSTVIDLYQRSTLTPNDCVPPFVLAESSLRIAKLLSAVHIACGLNKIALEHVVVGKAITSEGQSRAAYPPRAEIAAWAMRAYQGPVDSLSLADKLHIFSGLVSILGLIGFHRRRAFFLREITTALIPALVQARVAGAAGMGIHPAASLAMSENTTFSREVMQKTRQSASSLNSLLVSLSLAYGIPNTNSSSDMERCIVSGYGWPELQSDILSNCIAISEAIPDLEAVLQYSTRTLEMMSAMMGRDEQVKMVSNIPRIISAGKRLGLSALEVEYWDQYLLRDIAISVDVSNIPVKRRTHELLAVDGSGHKKDPFLYNPYSKKISQIISPTVVSDEIVTLKVTLQNPFEFDIEVQSLDLIGHGVPFECQTGKAFVRASSLETIVLDLVARSAGDLILTGADIRVTGCRASVFHIRRAPTVIDVNIWHLKTGGTSRTKLHGTNANYAITSSESEETLGNPHEVSMIVLPTAPTLTLRSAERQSQLSLSLLEGEQSTLTLKLHNESVTPVNFVSFSFNDSTTKPLEAAINTRNKQPHEIYELETFLYNRKAMSYEPTPRASHIAGKSDTSFDIMVEGKRGFNSGEIIVNYGYLPVSGNPEDHDNIQASPPEEFFTRQLLIPMKAIVVPAIDVVHCDIIPIPNLAPQSILKNPELHTQFVAIQETLKAPEEYCLILLDIRNVQTYDLTMTLCLQYPGDDADHKIMKEVIQAGQQRRMILPTRRIRLSEEQSRKSIPSLAERQFVLSSKHNAEAFPLEMFWAREELLNRLTLTWSTHDRHGDIEKRAIAINKRMLKALLIEPLRLSLQFTSIAEAEVKTDQEFSLDLKIINDTNEQLLLFVRTQIMLASTGELEGGTRLILHGLSQYPVTIAANVTQQNTLRLTSMNSGRYKVGVSCEVLDGTMKGEIRLARDLEITVAD